MQQNWFDCDKCHNSQINHVKHALMRAYITWWHFLFSLSPFHPCALAFLQCTIMLFLPLSSFSSRSRGLFFHQVTHLYVFVQERDNWWHDAVWWQANDASRREESDSSESKTGQVTTSAISKSRTSKHSKLRQDSLVWYRHLVEARHTTDCHGLENFSDQRRGNAAWTLWQSMEWSSATWDKCDQKSRWRGQVVW